MEENDLKMNNPATIPASQVSYLNVEITEKGASELSGGRRVVFIPKEEIQNIEIRFGSRAERPLLQTILGILLVGLGIVGLIIMLSGGSRGLRWGLGFIIFGGLGGFCLYEAARKGHYLRVISSKDARKLVFKGVVEKTELSSFIKASIQLGYNFRDCTIDRNIL